jgi:hypothetical protein
LDWSYDNHVREEMSGTVNMHGSGVKLITILFRYPSEIKTILVTKAQTAKKKVS